MPPKQPKASSHQQKAASNRYVPKNVRGSVHKTDKRDYKMKSPLIHSPRIISSTNDLFLTRLPTPLASPNTSEDTLISPHWSRDDRSPDSSVFEVLLESSDDDPELLVGYIYASEESDIETVPLSSVIILDSKSPQHPTSPKSPPFVPPITGRKYRQSILKYKNSKPAPSPLGLQLIERPPTHPNHRDPRKYIDRWKSPSPSPSPNLSPRSPVHPSPSGTVMQGNTSLTTERDQMVDHLPTPMQSSTDTFTLSSQCTPSQSIIFNEDCCPDPLQNNKILEDLIIERLVAPKQENHHRMPSLDENFYFPDFDEDSSDNAVEPTISFIYRLDTPSEMPISRPFSRLNDNVPFYVPDAENFPENGIPDTMDYNNNLVSLNDLPQDYSEMNAVVVRPTDVSYSAPSSMVHDSLESCVCDDDKLQSENKLLHQADAFMVEDLSDSLNGGCEVSRKHSIAEGNMETITINTSYQDIYLIQSDMAIFSETFDLLVPNSQQNNQFVYKHVKVDILSNNICMICRYPFYKPVSLECAHMFCAECIHYCTLLWKHQCPICNAHISHSPHVDEIASEQLATQVDYHMEPSVGSLVRVLVPCGKVLTHSCGILTSIQNGFSFEGADGIHVRSAQLIGKTIKQAQQPAYAKCSGIPCKIATVQCGPSTWFGRLCDILIVDPNKLPLGTRTDDRSLYILCTDVINVISTLPTKSTTPSDNIIKYMEPRFLHTFKYTLDNLIGGVQIYTLIEESFGSDTTSLLSTNLERIDGPPTSSLLRICTDLSEWLLMPDICCVNCKMIAQLPVRLHCGCLSCMICALDCYHNGWSCFSCGTSIVFSELSLNRLRIDTEKNIVYSLPLKKSRPVGAIPLDSRILKEIYGMKVSDPLLSKYAPVHVLQESSTETSFGLLLTEPNEKTAKVMLKSGTMITVDISRIRPIPLESLRLALRVQTPLVVTFNIGKENFVSTCLPLLGVTDMTIPRQYITRHGKHKGMAADDRSLASLSVFTMVYNIDDFLNQMSNLIDEIHAHNEKIRRSHLYEQYKTVYISRIERIKSEKLVENEQEPDSLVPIPTTNLQDAISQSQEGYFAEQFNDLIKNQEKIEQDLRLFGLLECSRFSNYIKLLSGFTISEFICTACTRIAIWPVRLPCGHLTCKTCAAIYYVSQIPCLLCGYLLENITDVNPDLRTLQKICIHVPGKLHTEQIDCGTYVCKPANRSMGVGIVLNTMSRGGILFATVGFVRSIGTFRLAELAVLLPIIDVSRFDQSKGRDTPTLIENPNNAVGEACIVVSDGPYKDIKGLIVRRTGTKADVKLTVVLEVGVVASFGSAELRIIKLIGPLCKYSKLRAFCQQAEKSFMTLEQYTLKLEIETSVREELGVDENLSLAGKTPPPQPRTLYSYLPKMNVVNIQRLVSRSSTKTKSIN